MRKITNPYQVSEFGRELGGEALRHQYHIWENIIDFAKMKREIKSSIGHNLHIAQTYDTVSIFLLYHDDESIDLKKEFFDRGVLCVSGSDFTSLGKNFVRIRLPKIDEFPVLYKAITDIDQGR
jgi:histidinol-phosphate aminotransferase